MQIFSKAKEIFNKINKKYEKSIIWKAFTEHLSLIIIGAMTAFIVAVFYQFGYTFLYGYYLGRDADTTNILIGLNMLLSSINVNQLIFMTDCIPFDIRHVAALGALILIFLLVVIFTTYQCLCLKNEFKHKLLYWIILAIEYIVLNLLLLTLTGTTDDAQSQYYASVFSVFNFVYLCVGFVCVIERVVESEKIYFSQWISAFIFTFFLVGYDALVSNIVAKYMSVTYKFLIWWVIFALQYLIILLPEFLIKFIPRVWLMIKESCKSEEEKEIEKKAREEEEKEKRIEEQSIKELSIKEERRKKQGLRSIVVSIMNNSCEKEKNKRIEYLEIGGFFMLIVVLLFTFLMFNSLFYEIGCMAGISIKNTQCVSIINQEGDYACYGSFITQEGNRYYIADNEKALRIVTSDDAKITISGNDISENNQE